jgi:hypothetical protein
MWVGGKKRGEMNECGDAQRKRSYNVTAGGWRVAEGGGELRGTRV